MTITTPTTTRAGRSHGRAGRAGHDGRRSAVRGAGTLLVGVLALASTSGCSGEDATADDTGASRAPEPASVVTVVAEPTIAVDPRRGVPAPEGRVLLTVTGGEVTNVGDSLQLDRAMLEQLGTASLTVMDEQATGGEHEFSGPLMADVLELAGTGDATTMHATAVNDYVIDVPVSDATDLPLLLATEMDGEPMSVADYGPLRFVYPDEALDLDPAVYDARWIWQLVELDLR